MAAPKDMIQEASLRLSYSLMVKGLSSSCVVIFAEDMYDKDCCRYDVNVMSDRDAMEQLASRYCINYTGVAKNIFI